MRFNFNERVHWYVYGCRFDGRIQEPFNAGSYLVERGKRTVMGTTIPDVDLVHGSRLHRSK